MKEEEVNVKSIQEIPVEVDKVVEGEKPRFTKAQEQAMYRQQEAQRKIEQTNRANYKKELISSNELKSEQLREIRLNIDYYKAKKEWMDLIPEIEILEAKEKAMIQKEREEQQKKLNKIIEDQKKEKEKLVTPEIILPKIGVPREKE